MDPATKRRSILRANSVCVRRSPLVQIDRGRYSSLQTNKILALTFVSDCSRWQDECFLYPRREQFYEMLPLVAKITTMTALMFVCKCPEYHHASIKVLDDMLNHCRRRKSTHVFLQDIHTGKHISTCTA